VKLKALAVRHTFYFDGSVSVRHTFYIDGSVSFGGTLFQQVVGIPMGTNCAPLLADLYGRNSANLELLIDKTSSIYLYVKLKALAS
jgi:hypothetical protein